MSWIYYVKPVLEYAVKRIDPIDPKYHPFEWIPSWGYRTDWTVGTPHARVRTPMQDQVSQPQLSRPRGAFITYDNSEMSIYARRP